MITIDRKSYKPRWRYTIHVDYKTVCSEYGYLASLQGMKFRHATTARHAVEVCIHQNAGNEISIVWLRGEAWVKVGKSPKARKVATVVYNF